jgi:hypothetical protein
LQIRSGVHLACDAIAEHTSLWRFCAKRILSSRAQSSSLTGPISA